MSAKALRWGPQRIKPLCAGQKIQASIQIPGTALSFAKYPGCTPEQSQAAPRFA